MTCDRITNMKTEFINHPLLKTDMIERRDYQVNIATTATEHDVMAIVPTGMGKSQIFMLVMLTRLGKGKILVLAPTRPLVDQHFNLIKNTIAVEAITRLDGTIKPEDRATVFNKSLVVVSTPQTIRNDLVAGRISLADVSLVIYDECHRGVGEYAYCDIAKYYSAFGPDDRRSLGLTASPGHTTKKLQEVMENLQLTKAEVRTEESLDVAPYIQTVPVEIRHVELTRSMELVRGMLRNMYNLALDDLNVRHTISKQELLTIQKKAAMQKTYRIMSITARALKLSHAILLAETQGLKPLSSYVRKMYNDETKAAALITSHPDWARIGKMCVAHPDFNPKMRELDIIFRQFEGKALVFCTYRATVDWVTHHLNERDTKAARFIGQNKGMTQKEQKKTVQEFKDGKHDVLVCTSIGEEGIDISQVDLVVFYEPVPSAIRSIQRKGRTGRTRAGKCVILVTKDTADEVMLRVADKKMESMKKALRG